MKNLDKQTIACVPGSFPGAHCYPAFMEKFDEKA